jgi:signal transduction histidine kinase
MSVPASPVDRTRSVARNLTLALILTVALVSVVTVSLAYLNAARKARAQLEAKADEFVKFLAETEEMPLWNLDEIAIQKVGEVYAQNPLVSALIITDGSRKVCFHLAKPADATLVYRSAEILHGSSVIGHVALAVTATPYMAANRHLFWSAVGTALVIIFVLVAATGYFLQRFLRAPLNRLGEITNAFAAGRYDAPITAMPFVEFRPLVGLLGELGGKITQHMKELRESRDGLEQRVQERTRELAQSNDALRLEMQQRIHMQLQLTQALKLESVGRLAAGIAHEINTPIQYVGDNLQFMEGAFGDLTKLVMEYENVAAAITAGTITPVLLADVENCRQQTDVDFLKREIPTAIQQALEGVKQVARIVSAMKEFTHPGIREMTPSDLNKAVQTTLTVARNEWKHVAEVETDLAPDLPLVVCLPGEFNQVILNLVVNAAHAIGEVIAAGQTTKGVIRISTRRVDAWVEIRVADTGAGIPEAIRQNIFEPFFTTKPVGKGTGQGLAISHATIVKKHGGTLTFETEVGRGTTFVIRLPMPPQSPPLETPPQK